MDYVLESFNYWAKKEIVEIKGNICEIFLLRYGELMQPLSAVSKPFFHVFHGGLWGH